MTADTPERDDIERAWARIASYIRRTPIVVVDSRELGLEQPGFELTLKLESLQHTGSFKPRGAFSRVLASEVPAAGLIAASGGNHGLAVAHVARTLGHQAEIFVPVSAPAIKVARLRALASRVYQVGAVYDEARQAAEIRVRDTGAVMVHAYDQPEVVAGAGTLGRELQAQAGELDSVLVAVGGGGLIAGTAAWFRGEARVISVEPEGCSAMHAAQVAGGPVAVEVGGLAVDSLAARQVGDIAYACAERWVDDSLLLHDEVIRTAQRLLWERLRVVAEPGGATALAALVAGAYVPAADERVAVLVCGANTDPTSVTGAAGA